MHFHFVYLSFMVCYAYPVYSSLMVYLCLSCVFISHSVFMLTLCIHLSWCVYAYRVHSSLMVCLCLHYAFISHGVFMLTLCILLMHNVLCLPCAFFSHGVFMLILCILLSWCVYAYLVHSSLMVCLCLSCAFISHACCVYAYLVHSSLVLCHVCSIMCVCAEGPIFKPKLEHKKSFRH